MEYNISRTMFNNILSAFEDNEEIEIEDTEDNVVLIGKPYHISLFLEDEKLAASIFFIKNDKAESYGFVVGE